MTYKEWLNAEYPNHRVLNTSDDLGYLGKAYRGYVYKATGGNAAKYFTQKHWPEQTVRFNEATQTPTEPADEERLERVIETYPQGLFTKSIQEHDPVNRPKHYTDGKIKVIDFIEDKKLGYHLGNTVKYIARAGKKDPSKEKEDLEKAKWYLERKIKQLCHTQVKSGSSW